MKPTEASRLGMRERGMTLVEVLVGVAIGMIAMIVMFQTISVWDARTRSTSAGSDSQVAGTLAMYSLERDLRLAGMGFGGASPAEMGCPLTGYSAAAASAIGPFPFVPIAIVDGGASAPDRIVTFYGNSPYFVQAEAFSGGTPHAVTTRSRVGFKAGDVAIVTESGGIPRCQLVQVVDNAASGNDKTLTFDAVPYTDFYSGASAAAPAFNGANGISPVIANGNVYSLGPRPRRNTWQVVNDAFGYSDDDIQAIPFSAVTEGVIDMKAEYGYDADGDNRVSGTEWSKNPPTDWTKVRAIHVAMLSRSRNFEKPSAASSPEQHYQADNPVWFPASGAAAVQFVMHDLNGVGDSQIANDPNNWRYYRYRVYEKVIPLRNVMWGQ